MFFSSYCSIVIKKGGGKGPEKPWQPSKDWCQFLPGKVISGGDDGSKLYHNMRTVYRYYLFRVSSEGVFFI
jgi:hypothetical protein